MASPAHSGLALALALPLLLAAAEGERPPSHPDLERRFRFLRALDGESEGENDRRLLALPLAAAGGGVAAALRLPKLPGALDHRFREKRWLGSGAFGATFLAEDLESGGKLVAVKFLRDGGAGTSRTPAWLTPKTCATSPRALALAREASEECGKIRAVHSQDSLDEEGAKRVLRCLEDGVAPGLAEDESSQRPLFLVLNYVGTDLHRAWHLFAQTHGVVSPAEKSRRLRLLARELFLGLRFLGRARWVHHDVTPANLAVQGAADETLGFSFAEDEGDEGRNALSLIDLGAALSEEQSDARSSCTQSFRPPEHLAGGRRVGWQAPLHAFDAASAALALLALGLARRGLSPAVSDYALERGLWEMWRLETVGRLGHCMEEQLAGKDGSTESWLSSWSQCWRHEGFEKFLAAALDERLQEAWRADSVPQRAKAIYGLAACTGVVASDLLDKAMSWQIASEWAATGFDRVLLRSLDRNLELRPTPEQVLASDWLRSDAKFDAAEGPPPQPSCADPVQKVAAERLVFIVTPVALVASTVFVGAVVCAVGLCCHVTGRAPSAAFTAAELVLTSLSTSATSLLWLDEKEAPYAIVASCVLAPGAIVAGCLLARVPLSRTFQKLWLFTLVCAAVFFIAALAVAWRVAGPALRMLAWLDGHFPEFRAASEAAGLLLVFEHEHVLWTELFVLLTFVPAFLGLGSALFGAWRLWIARRRRRFPQQRSARGCEEGTELSPMRR